MCSAQAVQVGGSLPLPSLGFAALQFREPNAEDQRQNRILVNNSETKQLIGQPESMSGLAHLFGPAVLVAVASLFLYTFVRGANEIFFRVFFGCVLLCSAVVTTFVGSVWAVFGLGSYLKRLCWSYLICAIVGVGHLAGFMLSIAGNMGGNQFFEPINYFLLGVVPVSLAAQIPMGFFRVFFGWQFTFEGKPPVNAFQLRDIFVFTFLVALGFAGPQMAVTQANNSRWFDPTSSYEEVTAPDGTVSWEEVVVTDQKVIDEKVRNFEQRNRFNILSGYAVVAAWGFGISLLSLPIPLLIFGAKDEETGCALIFAYAIAWIFLIIIILTVIVPFGVGEPLLYIGSFLMSYVTMVSLAFIWSFKQGFRLTSPRRFSRETTAATPEST